MLYGDKRTQLAYQKIESVKLLPKNPPSQGSQCGFYSASSTKPLRRRIQPLREHTQTQPKCTISLSPATCSKAALTYQIENRAHHINLSACQILDNSKEKTGTLLRDHG